MSSPRRRAAQSVGWTLGVWITILNGIVVGYGSLWFQIGGSTPDAGSYRVSAGGYAAAAAVLLLAWPALLRHRRSGWLVPVAGVAGVLMGLLALRSGLMVPHASESEFGTFLDGAGGVLWGPWTWVMVLLGLLAGLRALADP